MREDFDQRKRNTLGDISVLYVAVIARAIEAQGVDPVPLLAQFGLDERLLAAPDARISIPRFMRLGQAAIELTGNSALGLVMGELTRPIDAGRAGLAAEAAPDCGSALGTLIEFDLLTSQNSRGQPTINLTAGQADFYSIRPYNIFNYFVVDSVLAAWTRFLRTVSGKNRVLARVTVEYPSRGLDTAFEDWFGCPVTFGGDNNRLHLLPDIPTRPSVFSQPAMYRLLREDCSRALKRLRSGWGIQDRVKEKLASLLEGEPPSLEQVAVELGMAPWTLQRRLATENTGFRELVDVTRKDLALDYVRETRLTFSEIAWLLGFSGPAAFHKAYRRWSGMSPGEHRSRFSEEQQTKGLYQ
ncbi:AraC family transcriptional regulator [Marinobacter sp.]|uniref:AraC family transcriptional regulator n=1 Tax=Marinobacter sp. TaxID=50741 RepID=UPI00384FB974